MGNNMSIFDTMCLCMIMNNKTDKNNFADQYIRCLLLQKEWEKFQANWEKEINKKRAQIDDKLQQIKKLVNEIQEMLY